MNIDIDKEYRYQILDMISDLKLFLEYFRWVDNGFQKMPNKYLVDGFRMGPPLN
jgi:hypothetical protein